MGFKLRALGITAAILILISITGGTAAASKVYTVKKGDSLWKIAKEFGVSIDDIKRINNVSANKPLQIGVKLTIPSKQELQQDQEEKAREAEIEQKEINRFGPRIAKQLDQKEEEADEDDPPQIVRTALTYRGARYVRGGTGSRGFDCSGFTRFIYKKYGVDLPHSSKSQASCGKHVDRDDLQPGDLVFFRTRKGGISHVGIYIGDNKFIHASTPKSGVIVSSLGQQYYASRYAGARRIEVKKD